MPVLYKNKWVGGGGGGGGGGSEPPLVVMDLINKHPGMKGGVRPPTHPPTHLFTQSIHLLSCSLDRLFIHPPTRPPT